MKIKIAIVPSTLELEIEPDEVLAEIRLQAKAIREATGRRHAPAPRVTAETIRAAIADLIIDRLAVSPPSFRIESDGRAQVRAVQRRHRQVQR